MSRHPFETVSFAFGTIFLVMAMVGFADAAGLVTEGLIAAVIGTIVMMAVIGIVLTARRLASDDMASYTLTDDQSWDEGSEALDPATTTPTSPEGDDPEPLRL